MTRKNKNILMDKYAIRIFKLRCRLDRELNNCTCYGTATVIENHIEATRHKIDLLMGG